MRLIKLSYRKIEFAVKELVAWIFLVMSGSNKASSKRLAFLAVVTAGIVWLSADLRKHGITDQWVVSFQTLVAFASGSYVVGHGIDTIGKKKEDKEDEPN